MRLRTKDKWKETEEGGRRRGIIDDLGITRNCPSCRYGLVASGNVNKEGKKDAP